MHCLADDLLLLALHDETGIDEAGARSIPYGLAGALLADLTLRGRVEVQGRVLAVRDATPTGDGLLDAALASIASQPKPQPAQAWVARLKTEMPNLRQRVLRRLVQRGILRSERRRTLLVLPSERFPAADGSHERELRRQIHAVVLDGAEPDARMTVLLSLVQTCGLVDALVPVRKRAAARRRVAALTKEHRLPPEGTGVTAGAAPSAAGDAIDTAFGIGSVVAFVMDIGSLFDW